MAIENLWEAVSYSSRYAELEKNDFEEKLPFMRGYRGSYNIVACEKPTLVGAD